MSTKDQLAQLLEPYADLLNVGTLEAMALRVLGAAFLLLAAFWISKGVQAVLVRRVRAHDSSDEGSIRVYRRFVQIFVWVIGVSLALHTLGIDLTHVFTGGGLLAVAIAFSMKDLSENIISGLVLRLERVIDHGDVLYTKDGERVKVKEIGLRATIVRTKDESDEIIPNSELVQQKVSNYTYRDSLHRLEATVGVAYDSDLRKVRATLEQVSAGLDWKSEQQQPQVQLVEFGDSSVIYRVLVWIEEPWIRGRLLSELNEAIWWGLKEADIVIAFPQLDVHFNKKGAGYI
jgi:small-conductance mechanosensitive channel